MVRTRERDHELMDDPLLDPLLHSQALDGLARLNSLSGAGRVVWAPIRRLYQELRGTLTGADPAVTGLSERPLRILDLACGSADVSLSLWQTARAAGMNIVVDGCDLSEVAIDSSSYRAEKLEAPSKFFKLDVLKDELPSGYDVIINSLFMHHLDEPDAVKLLQKMAEATQHLIVVNDLIRSETSLALVTFACHIVTRSPIVHFDGPTSVRAAFTPAEMNRIAKAAGLEQVRIQEKFPCRMRLTWRKGQVD